MVNTNYLTKEVEDHVRKSLGKNYRKRFTIRTVKLLTGRERKFDAVSTDYSVVASIKTSSARTGRGKDPSDKMSGAIAELYFLLLVDAPSRILVCTDFLFFTKLTKRMNGFLPEGISIKYIPLPGPMKREISQIRAESSKEAARNQGVK